MKRLFLLLSLLALICAGTFAIEAEFEAEVETEEDTFQEWPSYVSTRPYALVFHLSNCRVYKGLKEMYWYLSIA